LKDVYLGDKQGILAEGKPEYNIPPILTSWFCRKVLESLLQPNHIDQPIQKTEVNRIEPVLSISIPWKKILMYCTNQRVFISNEVLNRVTATEVNLIEHSIVKGTSWMKKLKKVKMIKMFSRVQIREREQIGAWNSDRNIKFGL
jgi:hypothetical protein